MINKNYYCKLHKNFPNEKLQNCLTTNTIRKSYIQKGITKCKHLIDLEDADNKIIMRLIKKDRNNNEFLLKFIKPEIIEKPKKRKKKYKRKKGVSEYEVMSEYKIKNIFETCISELEMLLEKGESKSNRVFRLKRRIKKIKIILRRRGIDF